MLIILGVCVVIVLGFMVIVALDSYIDVKRHIPWALILGSLVVGGFLAAMLQPVLLAMRPLPEPEVHRYPMFTADVLDTGDACVYTWSGQVYVWAREDIGIQLIDRCPKANEAEARWHQAQHAPRAMP